MSEHTKLCRAEFMTTVNGGIETGICQLPKKHKGEHDCTVTTPPASEPPMWECWRCGDLTENPGTEPMKCRECGQGSYHLLFPAS